MPFNANEHITNLRGKQYLEVKWRLVWFREDHPRGGIQTEIINTEPVLVRAIITSEEGQILATGHGSANDNGQNVVWKGKAIEKAETAAIGRALAHAGYGTQFAPEDDEEPDTVVDSPVASKNAQKPAINPFNGNKVQTPPPSPQNARKVTVSGFQVNLSKKNTPYQIFQLDANEYAYSFTRDPFRKAGYTVDSWAVVGNYELTPPAELTLEVNKTGQLEVKSVVMADVDFDALPKASGQ